jgi:O-6-methylguanine DNA methyltransferase
MDIHSPPTARSLTKTAITQSPAIPDQVIYSTGDSALGKVLVAHGSIGICAILMGENDQELTADLAARFPGRTLVPSKSRTNDDLKNVVRFIDTPTVGLDLKFDMRHGTVFQRRVWDVLLTVPCGATISYAALARRIGQPEAVQAVASACAANAIALGIPCHRVVRSDGTLSGYRWGVERKRALINKEALS